VARTVTALGGRRYRVEEASGLPSGYHQCGSVYVAARPETGGGGVRSRRRPWYRRWFGQSILDRLLYAIMDALKWEQKCTVQPQLGRTALEAVR
jgi:glycine/D-amino acid oxidase-like deaminating enzyme